MPSEETNWRQLHRSENADRARSIATTVASMGYDVQVVDASGVWAGTHEDQPGEGPYVVQVKSDDLAALADVLQEMIAEQEEFDQMMIERELRGMRMERRAMLIALIVVMMLLGLLGLLRM